MDGKHTIEDLQSFDISRLKWDNLDNSAQSVEKLYDVVRGKTAKAITWYMEKRRGRKVLAQWLRGLATLFAAAGFLPPVLALVTDKVPGELGYVLFVVAGSCLLINRTLGISSGWIRYVSTAFALTTALEEFQLEWAKTMALFGGKKPHQDEINQLLGKLQVFTQQINQLLENETATWATQFNEDLNLLERVVQSKSQIVGASKKLK